MYAYAILKCVYMCTYKCIHKLCITYSRLHRLIWNYNSCILSFICSSPYTGKLYIFYEYMIVKN